MVEVQKAVSLGYKIVKIYEVYHWEKTYKYNPQTGEGGLFAGYVNQFLKIKQSASGWPDWCKTEADCDNYISSYQEREGILLERELIGRNPGLRSVGKLCLNRWTCFSFMLGLRIMCFISLFVIKF